LELAGAELHGQVSDRSTPGWLLGCWEVRRGDRRIVERWEPATGGTFKGESRTWVGERLAGSEQIVLSPDSTGTWVYAADPDTQRPASFRATLLTDTLLVFENPSHDFPQRIGYRRTGADSLHAWIEGITPGAGRRVEFPFARVRCEPGP
jgi:hypothetical protein